MENNFKLRAKIIKIGDIQNYASCFQKREVVIETQEQYPQKISLELISGKVDIINPFQVGEIADFGIHLKGREWVSPQGEAKYFNTIVAWNILKVA